MTDTSSSSAVAPTAGRAAETTPKASIAATPLIRGGGDGGDKSELAVSTCLISDATASDHA